MSPFTGRPVALLALWLLACRESTAPDPVYSRLQNTAVGSRLSLSASLGRDSAGTPIALLTFSNRTSQPDSVFHGGCAFAAQLFRSDRDGAPAWTSVNPENLPCEDIGSIILVPGGEVRSVVAARIAAFYAVPAPPSGTWLTRVYLVANNQPTALPAGTLTLR